MSTRCHIAFYTVKEGEELKGKDILSKKPDALLYRHSDGYIKGVLPDIMPFLDFWRENRGLDDTEYCSARMLQYLGNKHDKLMLLFAKEMPMKDSKKEIKQTKKFSGTLGYGIAQDVHGDIEFFYAIGSNGMVYVYATEWNDEKTLVERSTFIAEIPVENYKKNKVYKQLTKSEKKKKDDGVVSPY